MKLMEGMERHHEDLFSSKDQIGASTSASFQPPPSSFQASSFSFGTRQGQGDQGPETSTSTFSSAPPPPPSTSTTARKMLFDDDSDHDYDHPRDASHASKPSYKIKPPMQGAMQTSHDISRETNLDEKKKVHGSLAGASAALQGMNYFQLILPLEHMITHSARDSAY